MRKEEGIKVSQLHFSIGAAFNRSRQVTQWCAIGVWMVIDYLLLVPMSGLGDVGARMMSLLAA